MNKLKLKKIMGRNLRRLRMSHGLSIAALATYMDITPGFLGLIERGERSLTALMMFRASESLEVPISTFYRCREYEDNLKDKSLPMGGDGD